MFLNGEIPAKILFVVNVDWFFLSHRLPIAIAAKAEGYEVHIACQLTEKGSGIHNYGFHIHELPIGRSSASLSQELKTLLAIRKLVKSIKPDVIHSVTIKPVLYTGLVTRFSNVARVASISGLGFIFIAEGFKAAIVRWIIGFVYKLALRRLRTKVIFQNPTDQELFVSSGIIKSNQALLVPGSGVDLDEYHFSPEPDGMPVVMLLARLLVDKGVLEFVEAARILKVQGLECRMVLVGDIDENPKSVSQSQLSSWVEGGVIEHWGYSDHVSDTYAKANIVVLPSYREGLPKSLIEAAACGRAVITTDVPGCRDAITPEVTGLLVQAKDSDSLAYAIAKLSADATLRASFGKAGRELAESEFDVGLVVDKHLTLYQELIEI